MYISPINKNTRVMSLAEFERFLHGKTVYAQSMSGQIEKWTPALVTRVRSGKRKGTVKDVYVPCRTIILPASVKLKGYPNTHWTTSGKMVYNMKRWTLGVNKHTRVFYGDTDFNKGLLFYVTTVPATPER